MPNISDFYTDRIVFEARFHPNFNFWDRAGHLWMEAERFFPGMKMVAAEPNHTQFETEEFLLVCATDALRVTCQTETKFSSFKESATKFFDNCIQILEVERFERLGLRKIFVKEFTDIKSAVEAATALSGISNLNSDFFKTDGVPKSVDYRILRQGDRVGSLIMVRTEERKMNAQLPWDFRRKAKLTLPEGFILIIDVDYFTATALSGDQVSAEEWIGSSHKEIQRGLEEFLNDNSRIAPKCS